MINIYDYDNSVGNQHHWKNAGIQYEGVYSIHTYLRDYIEFLVDVCDANNLERGEIPLDVSEFILGSYYNAVRKCTELENTINDFILSPGFDIRLSDMLCDKKEFTVDQVVNPEGRQFEQHPKAEMLQELLDLFNSGGRMPQS